MGLCGGARPPISRRQLFGSPHSGSQENEESSGEAHRFCFTHVVQTSKVGATLLKGFRTGLFYFTTTCGTLSVYRKPLVQLSLKYIKAFENIKNE